MESLQYAMEVVYRSIYESDVYLARTALGFAGIWSTVLDANTAGVAWHYSLAIGGIKLAVADKDCESAGTILNEYLKKIEQPARNMVQTPIDTEVCPECRSADLNITWIPVKFVSILATIVFWVPVPVHVEGIQCNNCGACWKNGGTRKLINCGQC